MPGMRLWPALLAVASIVLTVAPEAAGAAETVLSYKLWLGDDDDMDDNTYMGTETITVSSEDGQSFTVDGVQDLDFKVGIVLFVKHHIKRNKKWREVWRDGALVSFESETNKGDEIFKVVTKRVGPNLVVNVTKDGNAERPVELPAEAIPSTWWRESLFVNGTDIFSSSDGDVERLIDVQLVGEEEVDHAGKTVMARHYKMTLEENGEMEEQHLWYLGEGWLYKRRFDTRGGNVTYLLQ